MDTAQKLQKALKIVGFQVKRELCKYFVDQLRLSGVDLTNDGIAFEDCLTKLGSSLENNCTVNHSIERDHVQRAIDSILNTGLDQTEPIFNVINVYDFPRLVYEPDLKKYRCITKKPTFLSSADSKAQLFIDRYHSIMQRTKRNFHAANDALSLRTIDSLLTVKQATLDRSLVLGALMQMSDGSFSLEDPTGLLPLDLTHAKFHGGFFGEDSFVLISGIYEDRLMCVSSMVLPPGEEAAHSLVTFEGINYFGGYNTMRSQKYSNRLQQYFNQMPSDGYMLFLSEVRLDNELVMDSLRILFERMRENPPISIVLMGNYLSEQSNEDMNVLGTQFAKLGHLINAFPNLIAESQFVFVPGLLDPCFCHMAPRPPLPKMITDEMTRICPKVIFASNPCRIQFCTKEITVFRADLMSKLLKASIYKPPPEELADNLTRTILSQGHLTPMSLNAFPVHWDLDYTLRLYPLPDVLIIGDKSDMYQSTYRKCHVANPGSFEEISKFQFLMYTPATDTFMECQLID